MSFPEAVSLVTCLNKIGNRNTTSKKQQTILDASHLSWLSTATYWILWFYEDTFLGNEAFPPQRNWEMRHNSYSNSHKWLRFKLLISMQGSALNLTPKTNPSIRHIYMYAPSNEE